MSRGPTAKRELLSELDSKSVTTRESLGFPPDFHNKSFRQCCEGLTQLGPKLPSNTANVYFETRQHKASVKRPVCTEPSYTFQVRSIEAFLNTVIQLLLQQGAFQLIYILL